MKHKIIDHDYKHGSVILHRLVTFFFSGLLQFLLIITALLQSYYDGPVTGLVWSQNRYEHIFSIFVARFSPRGHISVEKIVLF